MLERHHIAAALLASPIVTRLALTVRDDQMRLRAAQKIADMILHGEQPESAHRDQLRLPL